MIHDKDWFIHCPIYYSHFHILNSYTAVKIILTTLNVSPLTLRNGPVLFVLLSSRYFFSWQPLLRLCPFWNHEKLPRPPKKSNIFFLKKIAFRAFNIHYMFFLFASNCVAQKNKSIEGMCMLIIYAAFLHFLHTVETRLVARIIRFSWRLLITNGCHVSSTGDLLE